MARTCMITGKRTVTGNNVSHAHNKTKRRFLPNLQTTSFYSDVLGGKSIKLKISTTGIRTIEHKGGIDSYLLNTPAKKLPVELRGIKKVMESKTAAK